MSSNTASRQKIAICLGGASPEHDVSVVTGLQVIDAIDITRFEPVPVYFSWDRKCYVGPGLDKRETYKPTPLKSEGVAEVRFARDSNGPHLISETKGLLGTKTQRTDIAAAVLSFHGLMGEDGRVQSMMDMLGIPYTGMRYTETALGMRKDLTKEFLKAHDIPVLTHAVLQKPKVGRIIPVEDLKKQVSANLLPVIIKPCSLGSSIGVAKVDSLEEMAEVLPSLFAKDERLIVEPAVQNLEEYNVSLRMTDDGVALSAIERPKSTADLLDFKEKYLSSGGGKKGGPKASGPKSPGTSSEGMLSLTRDINPDIDASFKAKIEDIATRAYLALGASGGPRIDFLYNKSSKELYFNEINPIPGSFAFFLWERAEVPLTFPDLLNHLIDEAISLDNYDASDPVPSDARLLPR